MLVVERHLIDGTPEIIRLCTQSKELYNKCNFLMRKAWFGDERLPDLNILVQETQGLDCFKNLHNTKTAKQTVRKVLMDWSNFKAALRAWKKDPSKFRRMPKPPYYKDKLAQVIFYNETIKKKPFKQGIITPTNNLFSVKCDKDFKQVVVTPKTFGFVVDVQYERESKKEKVSKDKVACIDIGVNNLFRPIHADVNGSLNIGRKVIGDKVYETFPDRSIAAMPVRVNPLVTRCV